MMATIPRRFSVHDADYDESLGRRLTIMLDGVDQSRRAQGYDLDAGTVTRARVHADGRFVIEGTASVPDARGKTKLHADGTPLLTDTYVAMETVSGRVEVILAD